jgi:RIO-like serine/threonine protein kinase
VNSEVDKVCTGILQTLYVNRKRTQGYPASILAEALELDEGEVEAGLEEMAEKGLVERVPEGFRISEKGYSVVYQRESSYCPYL